MAVSFEWRVGEIESDENDDNFIKNIEVRIFGTEDGVTKETRWEIPFDWDKDSIGSDFKSYADLTKAEGEATLIKWCKDTLGTEQVAKLEDVVRGYIVIHNNIPKLKKEKSSNFPAFPSVTE